MAYDEPQHCVASCHWNLSMTVHWSGLRANSTNISPDDLFLTLLVITNLVFFGKKTLLTWSGFPKDTNFFTSSLFFLFRSLSLHEGLVTPSPRPCLPPPFFLRAFVDSWACFSVKIYTIRLFHLLELTLEISAGLVSLLSPEQFTLFPRIRNS